MRSSDTRPSRRSATRRHRSAGRGRRSARKWIRELASVAVASFVVLLARSTFADHYVVPTGSMLPTVHAGDRVLVHKAAYGWRVPLTRYWLREGDAPARGDVVVLEAPSSGDVLLKRVVAVPGDLVAIRRGRVWLNGRAAPLGARAGQLIETLGERDHEVDLGLGGPDFGPIRVPAEHYLVMGDNRGDSHDGRMFGWVARDAILGRALGVYLRGGAPVWVGL